VSEPSKLPSRDMGALLMAMIDGEADAVEVKRVRAAMAADPKLAADAEAYRLTGRSLARLFDGIMAEAVPGQLVHTVMTAGIEGRRAAPAVRLVVARAPRWSGWLDGWRAPAAVFAATAIAFSAGLLVNGDVLHLAVAPVTLASNDPLVANGAVGEALSVSVTGAERNVVTSSGTVKIKMVETFRDSAGAACREYEAQAVVGPRQFGVACREQGAWHVKALLVGGARTGGQTTTAGDELGTALDDIAARIKSGDVVSMEAERKLIAEGW